MVTASKTKRKTTKDYQQEIFNSLVGYRTDPTGFMVNCLDVKHKHLWSKMIDVAESVRDNQLTAVPAAHSVSKTYGAGRIVVWFKSCFFPSTVITTAPNDNLVKNQLWREIHSAHSGAKIPLGGNMTTLLWDVKPNKRVLESLEPEERALWEKNFAIGFSTSPDQATEHATRMQGWHNEWVLIVIDEACGVLPQIWRTVMDSLVVNERVKVLAIGNLTDPLSEFGQVCEGKDKSWNIIRISVKDTPNFIEGREVIPGLSGRNYEQRIRKKYGIHSNTYKIRVEGKAPEYREGTFYGREYAQANKDGRIGNYPHEITKTVYRSFDLGDTYTAGIDVQFIEGRIRIIDCYWDNQGLGVAAAAAACKAKPYNYESYYAGPDLLTSNSKNPVTGKMIKDEAAELGMDLTAVIKHRFDDGIEAVRTIWPLLEINKPLCKVFIDAVKGYRKAKDERLSTDDQPCYNKTPIPKAWENHMMDALRHLAMAYRYMDMSLVKVDFDAVDDVNAWDYDPLGRKAG